MGYVTAQDKKALASWRNQVRSMTRGGRQSKPLAGAALERHIGALRFSRPDLVAMR